MIEAIKNWERTKAAAESWTPEEVLSWAFDTFGAQAAIASGFGAEGMVLIDIPSRLSGNAREFRVFSLDTDFLFPETYALMEAAERRYGIKVERATSVLTPEEQARAHGAALWARDPDQCCNLRKIQPLQRKLAELRAWIAAIRRDQTAARANAGKIEWDAKNQLVKINPLADWSSVQVWEYIQRNDVPYNPLHDSGYPSIGCTHCTRAVRPGEDTRAGRWAGFQKTECGLHERPSPSTSGLIMPGVN